LSGVDLLRTQVKDLLDFWTDKDDHDRPALLIMLAQHLQPVQMADSQNSVKSKITGGPAPWDDPVAHLLADVASGTRTIERGLDIALGFSIRTRGGSDGNTRHALSRIPDLVDALEGRSEYTELIAEARNTIGLWHRAALLLLGAERRWAHFRYRELEQLNEDGDVVNVFPGIACCPYCESPVRIQPDVADGGDKDRWACPECTQTRDCAQCTQRAAWAAVEAAEADRAVQGLRPLTYEEKAQIWTGTPVVYGCEHVTMFGCPHVKATHYDIGETDAFCVNRGCVDENGRRRSWPVDAWLGQLLTWQPDTRKTRLSA
jgi:hypothetical protein